MNVMVGYQGHNPIRDEEDHILNQTLKKPKIGGYSGFLPQSKTICGTPLIKFVEPTRQPRLDSFLPSISSSQNSSPQAKGSPFSTGNFSPGHHASSNFNSNCASPIMSPSKQGVKSPSLFRNYAKHMDIEERYARVVELLSKEHNQTQESLLYMLQAKLSEKNMSYAQQQIRMRKLFEGFDKNHDGYLDENEFRLCLENENLQLDDVQLLALFAYFDRQHIG